MTVASIKSRALRNISDVYNGCGTDDWREFEINGCFSHYWMETVLSKLCIGNSSP